jgi:hypothetical protein
VSSVKIGQSQAKGGENEVRVEAVSRSAVFTALS